eukprot:270746-Chlamydomonas_euryale.AAC.6
MTHGLAQGDMGLSLGSGGISFFGQTYGLVQGMAGSGSWAVQLSRLLAFSVHARQGFRFFVGEFRHKLSSPLSPHTPRYNLYHGPQVLSHVPAILTLIDFTGKVLYQNASSVEYMGDLLNTRWAGDAILPATPAEAHGRVRRRSRRHAAADARTHEAT